MCSRLTILAVAAVCAAACAARADAQAPVVRASARHASAPPKASAKKDATPAVVVIEREVFAYGGNGRRDPFKSLYTTSELRPTLGELRLVAVAYDPSGAGSVAILRDASTKEQHRVRVGTLLGRMRVARIQKKGVVFTIEERGYSRQETPGLNDSTAVRSK